MMIRHLTGVLSKYVSTGVHTFGRTFTLAMYGVLYQCDSGYGGIRGETVASTPLEAHNYGR